MPKIDFYILSTAEMEKILHFSCRLAEKIYHKKHPIYFHMKNNDEASQLDKMLWIWKDDSFLPHYLNNNIDNNTNSKIDNIPAIQIGINYKEINKEEKNNNNVLINLSQALPDCYEKFSRILEIIPHESSAQKEARIRYRFYQESAYPIQTHKLEIE